MATQKITIHDAITKQTVTRDMNSAELAQLDEAFPPTQIAGMRYPEKMMSTLGI